MQRAGGPLPYEADVDATDRMAADERIHGEVLPVSPRAVAYGCPGRFGPLSSARTTGWSATAPGARNWRHRCRRTNNLVHRPCGLARWRAVHGRREYVSVRSQRELLNRPSPTRSRSRRCRIWMWTPRLAGLQAQGMEHRRRRSMRVRCWPRCAWNLSRRRRSESTA